MLRRISEPLALTEASLLVLRPAMNAPVLNVEFLPVGPARAAVVVFAEEYGGYGLALGIRSNEGGQVAVFRNREPMDDSVPINDVLEPALSHAERMGFLFDDDMVAAMPGEQGRAQAKALWGRLTGEIDLPQPPKAAPPLPAATDPVLDLDEPLPGESADEAAAAPELLLDQEAMAPLERPLEREKPPRPRTKARSTAKPVDAGRRPTKKAASRAAPTAAAAPVPAKAKPLPPTQADASTLSKFRQADASADPGDSGSDLDAAERGSALGRIPLVRVRRGGDGVKRIPYLARLLSSF